MRPYCTIARWTPCAPPTTGSTGCPDGRTPFLTLYGDSDKITRGAEAVLQALIPGATGQPHAVLEEAGHFLQEDVGEELARRVVAFVGAA